MTNDSATLQSNLLRRKSGSKNGQQDMNNTIYLLSRGVHVMMNKSLDEELRERQRLHEEALKKTALVARVHHRLQHVLHSKYALLIVVILNIFDCSLVIGGLVLELKVIKSHNCGANSTTHSSPHISAHSKHTVETKIGHAFHKASIAILSILLLETILKIVCFGRRFLKSKFEVFDALVVTLSFIFDVYYVSGRTETDVEAAIVLALILPWRVVRVVNSMIVALRSHAHIKLLLLYKSKQYVEKQVTDLSDDLETLRQQMTKIKELAIQSGVPDWKISKIVADVFLDCKKRRNAVKTMVAMTMASAVQQNSHLITASRFWGPFSSLKSRMSRKKSSLTTSRRPKWPKWRRATHTVNSRKKYKIDVDKVRAKSFSYADPLSMSIEIPTPPVNDKIDVKSPTTNAENGNGDHVISPTRHVIPAEMPEVNNHSTHVDHGKPTPLIRGAKKERTSSYDPNGKLGRGSDELSNVASGVKLGTINASFKFDDSFSPSDVDNLSIFP